MHSVNGGLISASSVVSNAGINYWLPSPGHPGALHQNVCPASGLLHQNVCPAPGLLHKRKCPRVGPINDDVPGARHLHQHEDC